MGVLFRCIDNLLQALYILLLSMSDRSIEEQHQHFLS